MLAMLMPPITDSLDYHPDSPGAAHPAGPVSLHHTSRMTVQLRTGFERLTPAQLMEIEGVKLQVRPLVTTDKHADAPAHRTSVNHRDTPGTLSLTPATRAAIPVRLIPVP